MNPKASLCLILSLLMAGRALSESDDIRFIANVQVTITKNSTTPSGVTFLLTGSQIPLSEYRSTKEVLLGQNQWVVGFAINVLWPPTEKNHGIKALKVRQIFDVLRQEDSAVLPYWYNIVGHSVGGQIALISAARTDPARVHTVIALDPVDEHPVLFTNEDEEKNESLMDSNAVIIMTLTDGGRGIKPEHNALAIQSRNDNAKLVRDKGAGHMAYTDNGGGIFGWLIPGGTKEANQKARDGAHDLIREYISAIPFA